jgi:hypothetical protein
MSEAFEKEIQKNSKTVCNLDFYGGGEGKGGIFKLVTVPY